MCWSAIASPGTSPCVAADAAPSATAPIAAPMAAAIPRDIIRHLHLRSGCRRVRPLWYGHRRYKFGIAAEEAQEEASCTYLCLEVDSIARLPSRRGSIFTQLSKKPDGRHRLCDATHSRAWSESRLGGPDKRGEALRDALDLVPEGGNLRPIGTAQVLQVGGVADHLVQHVLHRLRFAARHPERPLELFLRLGGQLVPSVVALVEELLLGHLVQERVDGTRRGPPPALRHRLDLVHDLCAVLRRVREDRNDPRAQTSAAVHHPTEKGEHVLRKSYRITDIYPLPLESIFRYRKSDIPKYGPHHRPRGGIHHGKHASGS